MSKPIAVDVQDQVYDGIEQFSQARGLDVIEGVKWLLGDFVYNNVSLRSGVVGRATPVSATFPMQSWPQTDVFNLIRFVYTELLKKNPPKCISCSADLTIKDIEQNECPKCHKKIV